MRQMSRQGKVKAALQDDDDLKVLAQILGPQVLSVDSSAKELSGTDEADLLKASSPIAWDDYDALLHYQRKRGNFLYSVYDETARNPDFTFLLPNAQKPTAVYIGDRTFSIRQSHEGNSAIEFKHPETGCRGTGFIESILSVPLESRVKTFFVVRCHRPLSPLEEQQAPFKSFNEKYCVRIMDELPSNNRLIIQHEHVVAHVSTLRRPAGTYGIQRETLVVCWALNRGRR